MDDRLRCSFFVVTSGKPSRQVEAHLMAEHRDRSGAGPVVLADALVEDAAEKVDDRRAWQCLVLTKLTVPPRISPRYPGRFRSRRRRSPCERRGSGGPDRAAERLWRIGIGRLLPLDNAAIRPPRQPVSSCPRLSIPGCDLILDLPAARPAMAINGYRNKPIGPGGGTRRLHQSPSSSLGFRRGRNRIDEGVKGGLLLGMVPPLSGQFNSCQRQLCSGCGGCVSGS